MTETDILNLFRVFNFKINFRTVIGGDEYTLQNVCYDPWWYDLMRLKKDGKIGGRDSEEYKFAENMGLPTGYWSNVAKIYAAITYGTVIEKANEDGELQLYCRFTDGAGWTVDREKYLQLSTTSGVRWAGSHHWTGMDMGNWIFNKQHKHDMPVKAVFKSTS